MKADANVVSTEKQIIVVFRFDDYATRKPADIERKIIKAFQKYGVSCTFGVIPYDGGPRGALNQEKADILINAMKTGTIEVALHGFYHISRGERRKSEFSGLDFATQLEKIEKGKKFLEDMLDIEIKTFIPPFNSYDSNTIRALEKLNFEILSANCLGIAKEFSSLKFLPATCGLNKLRNAIQSARSIRELHPVIIVMFHHYDFLDVDRQRGKVSYVDFIHLLDWLTSQKDIYVGSVGQAAKLIADLDSSRYLDFKSYYQLYILIPSILERLCHLPVGLYLMPSAVLNMKRVLWPLVLIFYLGILIITLGLALYIGNIMFPRLTVLVSLTRYGGAALLILLPIYALSDSTLGMKAALTITVVLGAYIGAWLSYLTLTKQDKSG